MCRFVRFSVVICGVVLMLAGCGGGGGGNSARPPISTLATEAEFREDISAIGFAATGLTMTDLITTPGSRVFPNSRAESVCSGTSCSPEPEYGEPGFSAVELSTIDPNATIRIGEMQHGVNNGQLHGRISYQEPDYPGGEDWTIDYTVYGGWLGKQFFGIEYDRWQGRGLYGSVDGLETLIAFSAGVESGSNPVSGSATWGGLMVGLDKTTPTQAVNGQASLTFDFSDQTLDVGLTNISGPGTYADINWNGLAVQSGGFGDGADSNSLSGSFYGPNHEEVGGVFERNQLIGAFGARRQ